MGCDGRGQIHLWTGQCGMLGDQRNLRGDIEIGLPDGEVDRVLEGAGQIGDLADALASTRPTRAARGFLAAQRPGDDQRSAPRPGSGRMLGQDQAIPLALLTMIIHHVHDTTHQEHPQATWMAGFNVRVDIKVTQRLGVEMLAFV